MEPEFQSSCGRVTLYHGDCRDIAPTLESVDAVMTDPPYGINYEASRYRNAVFNGVIHGDADAFDPSWIMKMKCPMVLWGGNNFANVLPPGGWLVWDKRTNEAADKMMGSPFELAWCSIRTTYKMLRLLHAGCVNADSVKGNNERRLHPTQKPVRVMSWSMEQAKVPEGATVLDPYMGSGSTGIACIRSGRRFVGIEKDPTHYATALERIKNELAQGDLFLNQSPHGSPG